MSPFNLVIKVKGQLHRQMANLRDKRLLKNNAHRANLYTNETNETNVCWRTTPTYTTIRLSRCAAGKNVDPITKTDVTRRLDEKTFALSMWTVYKFVRLKNQKAVMGLSKLSVSSTICAGYRCVKMSQRSRLLSVMRFRMEKNARHPLGVPKSLVVLFRRHFQALPWLSQCVRASCLTKLGLSTFVSFWTTCIQWSGLWNLKYVLLNGSKKQFFSSNFY